MTSRCSKNSRSNSEKLEGRFCGIGIPSKVNRFGTHHIDRSFKLQNFPCCVNLLASWLVVVRGFFTMSLKLLDFMISTLKNVQSIESSVAVVAVVAVFMLRKREKGMARGMEVSSKRNDVGSCRVALQQYWAAAIERVAAGFMWHNMSSIEQDGISQSCNAGAWCGG